MQQMHVYKCIWIGRKSNEKISQNKLSSVMSLHFFQNLIKYVICSFLFSLIFGYIYNKFVRCWEMLIANIDQIQFEATKSFFESSDESIIKKMDTYLHVQKSHFFDYSKASKNNWKMITKTFNDELNFLTILWNETFQR